MSEPRVTINVTESEQRMYERLRSRLVTPRAGTASGMWDLMLLLPDLVVLLVRLARDPQVPPGAKLVAAGAVAYVLSPLDLLPELLLGPLGVLDDLLVVGAGLSFLMNRVHPDLIRAHWPGQQDALEAVQSLTAWTEGQVADRAFDAIRGLGRLARRALR